MLIIFSIGTARTLLNLHKISHVNTARRLNVCTRQTDGFYSCDGRRTLVVILLIRCDVRWDLELIDKRYIGSIERSTWILNKICRLSRGSAVCTLRQSVYPPLLLCIYLDVISQQTHTHTHVLTHTRVVNGYYDRIIIKSVRQVKYLYNISLLLLFVQTSWRVNWIALEYDSVSTATTSTV